MPEPQGHRVLYMEDDVLQARLVQKCLEREGYCVDVVTDGLTGLQFFNERRYDAVVVDQTMPLRSGLDIIRDMVAHGPWIPTIMVTGTGNEQVAVDAMKLGVSDYIVKDLEGGFVHLLPVTIARAIRQHRLVEEKRQAEENLMLFRSFAEASAQGFGISDLQQRIQYVNPALCRILGETTPAAIVGRDCGDFFAPQGRQDLLRRIGESIVRHGEWTGEAALISAAGAAIPVLQCVFPIRDAKGAPMCLGMTVTDMSERKRMEHELLQSQKLESIGQLAAGIAHEINTPIQYVGDNAHFLQDAFRDIVSLLSLFDRLTETVKRGETPDRILHEVEEKRESIELDYLTEEIPKAIHQSLEGVSRAASIVGAMKEFSHPGCVEKQAVDLNHAIESTLTISRNEWKYVADMVTELDPDLPPVFCQPTEINQAILNLIVNAAHAIADAIQEDKNHKGVITVSTRRNGNWAEIRVEDTGKGIPKSIRDRVFDPFFTTKEVGHGSGQGLAIARSIIVERHGGTIRFESEWNRGTTFIIRLPIHECEPTAPPAEHKKPSVLLNMPATESGNVSVPAVPLASGIGRVEGESV